MKRSRSFHEEELFLEYPSPYDDPEHPDHLVYVYYKFAEKKDKICKLEENNLYECTCGGKCDHCIEYDPERPIELSKEESCEDSYSC